MTSISSERIASIEARKHELSDAMSAPDMSREEFVRLSKEYSAIEPVAAAAREVRRLRAERLSLTEMTRDADAELRQIATEELAEIEGFDETVAQELKRRGHAWLESRDQELDEKRREMGVDDKVGETGGFTPAMMVSLGEKGVKTLDDLGDLAADELIEILGEDSVDEETANAISTMDQGNVLMREGLTRNAKVAQALAQIAMKLGQAIYEKEQAANATGGSDADAPQGSQTGGDEEVVDAEFSEVDDEAKS